MSAQLSANFNADIVSGCSPVVVNFQDNSSGNPSQWIWNLGNGTTSALQHPTTTYFLPGSYNVKLVIKNASGIDSIVKNQFIIVYANPVVSFNVSDSSGCYPKTIKFSDNSIAGSGIITQHTWDFGDGNISTQQNPVHTYTNAGSFDVTLKVINSMGCQKTITRFDLVQLQNSKADFSFSNAGPCNTSAVVNFTDLSNGAVSYKWNFGDGTSSSSSNPAHTYFGPGSYNVKLVTTVAYGCKDSITKTVIIGSIHADFSNTAACESSNVYFQNSSSPAPASVSWDFGDGTSSTSFNPVKNYIAAGSYQVKLVSDFGGCKDSVVKTVVVHPKPSSAFTQTGELIKCAPSASVSFSAVQNGLSYLWLFGDGTSSTLQSPSHTYTNYGSYDVTLISTNVGGCADTVKKASLVKIKAVEITSIDGAFEGCAPYTASFKSTTNSDLVSNWSWDFGDGTTSSAQYPAHLYALPGVYTVALKITTAGGCTATLNMPGAIKISNKPVAAFTATPLITCAAGPVQFNSNSTGAKDFKWIFTDGGFSSEENPSHQFGDTGFFSVTLIASSTGCSDTLTLHDYIRNEPPIGRFNLVRDCAKPYEVQFRDSSIGGQTYLWKFGDGDSSTLRYPVHTYRSTGTYHFEFTVFHGACSYKTGGSVLIIDEHPQIKINDSAICRNETVLLSASNINAANIASYQWNFGNGQPVVTTVDQVERKYLVNGRFYPSLITTDVLGCSDTTANSIELNVYGPQAGFTNSAGICLGSSAIFQDTSHSDDFHPIINRSFSFGDGNSQQSTGTSFAHIYNSKGVYDVQLKVADSFGCQDSISINGAIIIADPVAAFVSSDSVKCSSNLVSFNNTSDGFSLAYSWKFGDNSISNELHPSHAYESEGLFDVQLSVTDQFGCQDSVSRKQLISNPLARFVASDTFASCPPLLVNLSNQSSSFLDVTWEFGDGSVADFNNPSHYYNYPGTYELKIRSKGFGNCVDSAVKTIVIKGPTGQFNFSPPVVCTNAPVGFTASYKGGTGLLWDFSDGSTLVGKDTSAIHVYVSPGVYRPRMILIDSAGCQVPVTSTDSISVLGVQARFVSDKSLICDAAVVRFSDSSLIHNDLPASYQWNFGDGTSSSIANPSHYYNTTGTYITRLVVTTQAGCVDSVAAISPVSIVRSPQIAIKSNPEVCVNDPLNFSGVVLQSDSASLNWRWDFGNGAASTVRDPSQTFENDGVYQVKLVAMNENGCSDTAVQNILVHALPNVNAGTDTMICRGNTYSLQPSGAAVYEWQNDISLSCTSCSLAVANPVFDNIYYVTGTSEYGCKKTDSVAVRVQQPFAMSVNGDDSLCSGNSVQLKANGAAKYTWYPATGLNNASVNNPVAKPTVTTEYRVIGSDAKNCFTDTGVVKISVFPVPEFNIIEKSISVAAGTELKLNTSGSSDITKWKWYPLKDISCADCPQPVITAKENITYRAEVTNDGGCTTSDEVTVSVLCNDGNVFIPNTFSPNHDGMNDVFYPRGKGITSIKTMKIFNRWGELVYEKANFSANDAAAGWNGSYKGSQLTPDVYVYIVDVVCYNSTVFTLKGNVTLIR